MRYIYEIPFGKLSLEAANLNEVKSLIQNDEFSKDIGVIKPIFDDEICLINGTKELLKLFNQFDLKKIDYTTSLNDISFVSFNDNSMTFDFHEDDQSQLTRIYTIYNSHDFLLDKFCLRRFFYYCIDKKHDDIAFTNIQTMIERNKNENVQLRTIMQENSVFLRSITSSRYKNYDNHIGLYLLLTECHNYAKQYESEFTVVNGLITDSSILVDLMFESEISIDVDVQLYIGVRLVNNEISEGSLSIDYIYRVNDSGSTFKAVGDNVLNIVHTNTVETISQKLNKFENLKSYTEEIVNMIRKVNISKVLNEFVIFEIFDSIISKKILNKKQKESLDKLRNEVVEKTVSYIQLFSKIEETFLDSDVTVRVSLQKMFHDYLKNK